MPDIHTLPINDLVDHDESRDCWCQPTVKRLCPECDGDGCWMCGDGVLPGASPTEDALVVHNAADGRE